MSFPEKGRLAAHILIDGVVGADGDSYEAADVAYRRLNDVEVIPVKVDGVDEDGPDVTISIDMSHILGASLITISWLVDELARSTGRTKEDILFSIREYIDR